MGCRWEGQITGNFFSPLYLDVSIYVKSIFIMLISRSCMCSFDIKLFFVILNKFPSCREQNISSSQLLYCGRHDNSAGWAVSHRPKEIHCGNSGTIIRSEWGSFCRDMTTIEYDMKCRQRNLQWPQTNRRNNAAQVFMWMYRSGQSEKIWNWHVLQRKLNRKEY